MSTIDNNNQIARNITSYLDIVFGNASTDSHVRCYRGQADIAWDVKPSVMRQMKDNAENKIFSELMVEAPNEFSSDKSMFDKLVRAQHYGLPTRLLDVSLNPLVALFFACSDENHHDKDGTVITFDFHEKRVKFADSDAISLVCNLARLDDKERREITSKYREFDDRGEAEKQEIRDMPAMKRLCQFVRVEKSYFLDAAEPTDLFRYFFVYPSKNNRRVIAQSGAFVAAGLLKYRSIESSEFMGITKIRIPASSKNKILKQLDTLNINSRSMFPEVESASGYIKKKWSV
ncbi:FRG domain-containing protein [Burkholderia multivorans]|uniref:FRG domain-containing protein n=1 Tax=Burkholderia multivorans TaxID=87883 RepID=UPI0020A38CF8|nr:FRG domain-containing protein [Burkholderia multivorans]MCO8579469.1 FRG domain-containing protein [Burkholderia multivorans]